MNLNNFINFFFSIGPFSDAYEPPNCQNIPAPNVGTAPGPSVANTSTNPDTSNPTNSSSSNPTIPNTTSASTASSSSSVLTTVSSSETPPTNSGCSSSAAGCHHHSPYDLRKKTPSACGGENWLGCAGPSTSSAASATCTSTSQQQPSSSASHSHHHFSANSNNNANYDYLPARKRPRRTYSSTDTSTTMSAAHYLQFEMPDEVLLTIFSYLMEQDLCRVSLVCKRFQTIANDCELWKRLYQSVYEYDLPLFNPEPCKFIFMKVEDCEFPNPWKESFRQLYRGIHVRPNYQDRKCRNIAYFNTVQAALDYADERNASNNVAGATQMGSASMNSASNSNLSVNISPGSPINDDNMSVQESPGSLIFLHAGIYRGEFLVIDSDITLIGAAPGNVAESIVLERESESTVMFVEGAKNAYIGHMTLKFSPDITSTVPHHKHYCLEVGENCSPTIDHCIIRSTSVGEFFGIEILIFIGEFPDDSLQIN